MFEKIVVPLDGSILAEGILDQVEKLAELTGGEIMLLRVAYFHPFPGVDSLEFEQKAVDRAEAYLSRIASEMGQKGFRVSTHVRYGQPAEEIIRHADRYADLVVMTTHGRTGLGRWALGSVANRVVNHSRKPVLLFRAEAAGEA